MRLKIAVSVVRFRPWAPFTSRSIEIIQLFRLIFPTGHNRLGKVGNIRSGFVLVRLLDLLDVEIFNAVEIA